jgi:hypothetical protein
MNPEGSVDDSDQDGLPDEVEEDDPPCPPPVSDIWRAKVEDLGDNLQQR